MGSVEGGALRLEGAFGEGDPPVEPEDDGVFAERLEVSCRLTMAGCVGGSERLGGISVGRAIRLKRLWAEHAARAKPWICRRKMEHRSKKHVK